MSPRDLRDRAILIYLTGGAHWLGGVQYTRNLLRAIGLLPDGERPTVVLRVPPRIPEYEAEFAAYPHVVVDRPMTAPQVAPLLAWIRRQMRGADKVLKPRMIGDDCRVAFPIKGPELKTPGKRVFWIPDLQYKLLPQLYEAADIADRDRRYGEMLAEDTVMVLSSETIAEQLATFLPGPHKARIRILRFHTILEEEDYSPDPLAVCRKLELPEHFVYLPNQIYVHKRHDTAFEALVELREQGVTVPLVCTGASQDYRSEDHIGRLFAFLKENRLEQQVRMLGVIDRRDQLQIFRQAALILQPSMSEGWSTTVEDARSLGKRLLLSDIDVHKEQAPEGSVLFPVGDSAALAEKLRAVWPESAAGVDPAAERRARERMVENGQRYARRFLDIMADALR
jgi:glycosyltransferase involved in cell wall biosynthesis